MFSWTNISSKIEFFFFGCIASFKKDCVMVILPVCITLFIILMLYFIVFYFYLKTSNQEITPWFCIKLILLDKNKDKTTTSLKINFKLISLLIHPSNLNETKQIYTDIFHPVCDTCICSYWQGENKIPTCAKINRATWANSH